MQLLLGFAARLGLTVLSVASEILLQELLYT